MVKNILLQRSRRTRQLDACVKCWIGNVAQNIHAKSKENDCGLLRDYHILPRRKQNMLTGSKWHKRSRESKKAQVGPSRGWPVCSQNWARRKPSSQWIRAAGRPLDQRIYETTAANLVGSGAPSHRFSKMITIFTANPESRPSTSKRMLPLWTRVIHIVSFS